MDQRAAHEAFALETKIGEFETDVKEIELVLHTLKKTESSRKCFRMVGGVLIQRTAGEVQTALEQQQTQLNAAIAKMRENLNKDFAPTTAKATAPAEL